MIKTIFNKKSISILLVSFFWIGCQRPSDISKSTDTPIVTSGFTAIKARGYVEMQRDGKGDRVLFQALIDHQKRLYAEIKQMGVLGLVFAYAPGQSTLVIPKEKKAIYMQSQFPLVVLQDSKISDDFLFSVLLYDFSDLFAQTKYIKTEKHLRWYEDAGKTRLALDAHTGQLKKVYLLDQDVQVTFGPLRQNMNFPSIIDIQEGDNKIRWVWKQIDDQTKIPDAWFEVDIPSNFVVEEQ